ncbi:hypothetical protein DL768_009883 [Monosporascus sp. mg162]|nr:hypothetical protein DL768_009883 [Monosporascus sp. mg162]
MIRRDPESNPNSRISPLQDKVMGWSCGRSSTRPTSPTPGWAAAHGIIDIDIDKADKDDDEISQFIKKEEGAEYETGGLKQLFKVLTSGDALEQKRKNKMKKTDAAQAPDLWALSTSQYQRINSRHHNKQGVFLAHTPEENRHHLRRRSLLEQELRPRNAS